MNGPITPEHMRAAARNDFGLFARGAIATLEPAIEFKWNWHHDLIASKLQDVLDGKIKRLIINIPPRYGKSLLASVALPAFALGRDPYAKLICVSYAQELLSIPLATTMQTLMGRAWYQAIFATRLRPSRRSDLTTVEGGFRLSTSVGGTLTGRGGNITIIDDPLKPSEAASELQRTAVNKWYDDTVPTRSDDPENGAIIIIMQRLHEDDLVGHLLGKGDWEVVSLPAIAEYDETFEITNYRGTYTVGRKEGEALHPARQSLANLAQKKIDQGPYAFASQYQQRPAPAGGGDIELQWFGRYDLKNQPQFIRKIQVWDTASKEKERHDFSACVTIGETEGQQYFIIDLYRGRLKYPDLKREARRLAELHQVSTVLIEETSSGIALLQELTGEGFTRIEAVKASGSKYERIMTSTGLMQASKVWIPEQAHWVADFLDEAAMFPAGRNDDQLDALAHGLKFLTSNPGPRRWLTMMDEVNRSRGMTDDEDLPDPSALTVTFDHPTPTIEFKVPAGRFIKRSADGLYHATPEEWESVRYMRDVRLVRDRPAGGQSSGGK